MAADVTDLSPAEQVAAGFAIGVAGILAARFAGKYVVSKIVTHGPKLGAKKIAEAIAGDVAIGRLPVLQVGEKIGAREIGASLVTTSLWLLGGVPVLKDFALDVLEVHHSPSLVPDFVFDQPLSSQSDFWNMVSAGGAVQAITYNPAMIDP